MVTGEEVGDIITDEDQLRNWENEEVLFLGILLMQQNESESLVEAEDEDAYIEDLRKKQGK